MPNYRIKINYVLLPFAGVVLAAVCGYAILRLAVIVLGCDVITLEAWNMYIPALVSLVVLIVLSKKIKVLGKPIGKEWMCILSAVMTFMMLYNSQQYIVQRFSKTVQINDISQVEPNADYYHIDMIQVEPNVSASSFQMQKLMGRSSSHIKFSAYFAFKFVDAPSYWFAQKYSQTFHYSVFTTEQEVSDYASSFLKSVNYKLTNINFTQYHLFRRVHLSNDHIGFKSALRNARDIKFTQQEINSAIFLEPVYNEDAENESDYYLNLTLLTFFVGFILLSLWLVFIKLDIKTEDKPANKKAKLQRHGESIRDISRSLLLPDKHSWSLTLVLCALIACLLYMMLFGDSQLSPFWQWCALSREALEQDQWWRLVTHLFVMNDLLDVFGWICALFLANFIFSAHRTVIIFIVSGVIGAVVATFTQDIMFVGSSGATMGLCGAVLAVCALHKRERNGIYAVLAAVIFFSLVTGLRYNGITSSLTGFGVGAVLGLLLYKNPPKKKPRRKKTTAQITQEQITHKIQL